MHYKSQRGITLLETLIYIALLILILPPLVSSLIRVTREVSLLDVRSRINTTSALLASEFTSELIQATQVRVTQSTVGSSPGVLVFYDSTGQSVTIDRVSQSISFPGGNQTVRRLRMTRGASPAIYLTDPDIDVQAWQVDLVRNSTSVLTGLRFHFDFATLNQSTTDPHLNARLLSDFTVDLQPQTAEM